MKGTVREQKEKFLAAGCKPTGFTAMDGRFEVIRLPAGVHGCKVTWNVWDYNPAREWGDWVQIYGIDTLKRANERLVDYAARTLKGEISRQVHYANNDHFASWPDTVGKWYTAAECKAASWKLKTFHDEDDGVPYKMWVMPDGKIATLSNHPK